MSRTAEEIGVPNVAAAYLKSLEDPEIIERVRCTIADAHVFKLPKRPTAGGWRGAEWEKEVWQGTLKVVERGDMTVILLQEKGSTAIFAVCPVKEGAVDRCVDSSRYFVLRVENSDGKHMFVGVAFNERNDSFDFNTALEDSRREKEAEKNAVAYDYGEPKDLSMKDGEKIHISVDKIGGRRGSENSGKGDKNDKDRRRSTGGGNASGSAGGFLKPSKKDTPRRGSNN